VILLIVVLVVLHQSKSLLQEERILIFRKRNIKVQKGTRAEYKK
jgi:hypothetical protein